MSMSRTSARMRLEPRVLEDLPDALCAVSHLTPVDADHAGPRSGQKAANHDASDIAGGAGDQDGLLGCIRAHAIASCSSRTLITRSTSFPVIAGKRGTVSSHMA